MDKSKLLDQCGALGDDRLLLARVLDRARQASERNVPAATDFLSPAQQAMAMDMLLSLIHIFIVLEGGRNLVALEMIMQRIQAHIDAP